MELLSVQGVSTIVGLALVILLLWSRLKAWRRRRLEVTNAPTIKLARSGILALIAEPQSLLYYSQQHYLGEVAMVCARQGRDAIVRHLYQESGHSLNLYALLLAALDPQAETMVHQHLLLSGLLTLNEIQELVWAQPEPQAREDTCRTLIELIIEQGRERGDRMCISNLIKLCHDHQLELPMKYLRQFRLLAEESDS